MTMANISNKRLRDIQRVIHLVGAALLISYVYLPVSSMPLFAMLIKAVVLPLLGVTGLLLWQSTLVRKWLRR